MAVPLLLGNDWEAAQGLRLLHTAASSSKGAALRTTSVRAGFAEFELQVETGGCVSLICSSILQIFICVYCVIGIAVDKTHNDPVLKELILQRSLSLRCE